MPKAKKAQSSLGKSLMNKKRKDDISKAHTTDLSEPTDRLKSVIDQSSLKDFLQEVELSSRNFEALKETKVKTEHHVIDLNSVMNFKPKIQLDDKNLTLTIPRRPHWNASTTPEQLTQMENDSFLNWRRTLAKIEEELLIDRAMTPFEKNLEVWKQLWRVVEKSDILVQVVDGRNPLFFRSSDLEKYVKELDSSKENILLINKSDLLSDDIRKSWNRYLNEKGINHIFFSAKKEQEKIDTDRIDEEEAKKEEHEYLENTERIFTRKNLLIALTRIVLKVRQTKQEKQKDQVPEPESQPQEGSKGNKPAPGKHVTNPDLVTIGMVGYPNVGKSSVINVLSKKKLVGVAAQPGKTKHFQTLFIEKDLMLCDCPGLVFPNFTSNRAEMVCNGVIPIDKLKDILSPLQYLCLRIPKEVFETIYKVKIEIRNPSASQILQAYSKSRGYLTGRALPDEGKAARIFLKDLVSGKLLYCALPPDYDKQRDGNIIQYNHLPKDETTQQISSKKEDNEESKADQPVGEEDDEEDNPGDYSRVHHINDESFFDGDQVADDGDDPYEGFDNEELLMLILEGKPVRGIRLNKQQRRDLKFALKRGDKIDVNTLAKGYKSSTGVTSLGAHGTENYKRAKNPVAPGTEEK